MPKKARKERTIELKEFPMHEMIPNSKLAVIGKPGCFAAGTLVMMYDGTVKKVEDVSVGDVVMGDDSTPRNVIELCHDYEEMYKIKPKRGKSYTVNKKHKLVLKSCGYHSCKKGEILEISVEEYLKKSKGWKSRFAIFRNPVNFEAKPVKLDPYLLGYWLGDGNSLTSEITTADKEIVSYLRNFCKENELLLTDRSKKEDNITYRIRSEEGTKGKNFVLNFLRGTNLLGNKHIPHIYKCNSRDVRLQLLAGILDSDGYYDKRGRGYDITLKSKQLLKDVVFVAKTLGYSAFKRKCKKTCTNAKNGPKEGKYYRCFIGGNVDEIPCKIERKKALKRRCNRDPLVNRFEVVPKGEGEYFGFTLDGNHRFLLATCDVVRNTGKSTLIGNILYNFAHIFPVGQIYSGTEDSNHYYKKIFPNLFVYNDLNPERVIDFVRRQKIAVQQGVEVPWAIQILDDCTDDPKILTKKIFQGIFKKGRHWKMMFILSLQYSMDIKPVIRTNIDYTFILRETILSNREKLWKNYAGAINDFDDFCDILDQVTDDYSALVINNRVQSNKLEDIVYWYKADPKLLESFSFGCNEFWKWGNDRFEPTYVDPIY